MTKKHSTKRALIASILVLCLCMTSFIGTTFAWFTDSVTSNGNIIKSGTLDVEMYWADGKGAVDGASWADASKGPIFKNELWEPGYTEARHIKIANEGTLALKYQLAIIPRGEVSELADVIDVYYVEGGKQISDRADLSTLTPIGTLAELINNGIQQGSLKAGANFVATIVLKMQESAGNEYQDLAIGTDFAIQLLATQMTVEDDSFDNQYDKDAWKNGMTVYDEADFVSAMKNVKDNDVIVLSDDIALEEGVNSGGTWYEGYYYIGDKSFTIDLNGNTLGNNGSKINDYLMLFKNDGEKANAITIKNGTIDATSSVYCAICTSTTSTQKITINLEDVDVIGNNTNGSVIKVRGGAELNVKDGTVITGKNSYLAIENWQATVNICDGAEIYQNGTGSYNGCLVGVGGGNAVANVYGGYGKGVSGGFIAMTSGGTINVYGGEWIANTDGTYANDNKSVLVAQSESGASSVINVTGGSFKGGYNYYGGAVGDAQINIAGGTFNNNPANYVSANGLSIADGYKVAASNGDYIVLKGDAVATTSDELVKAINEADDGDTIILAPGDYALRFTNNTAFNVDNLNFVGVGEVNLSVSTSEVWYGRIQGSNVTFENINFISKDEYGANGVGATGKATYNDCTFATWAICASSNKEETYFNNCVINGCFNASTDFSSGDVFVKDTKIAKAEYSGSMTVNFENCEIDEVIIWNSNTNFKNCEIAKMDLSGVTSAKITVDGITQKSAATQDALNSAVSSGNVNVTLADGEYKMPSSDSTTGEVKISGTKDAVLDVTQGAYLNHADGVTIEGVTIKTSTGMANGNGSDYAALYAKDVTYVNCTFVGPMRVGRDGAKFVDCTFTELGNDYVWTYGNDVTFEGCTFESAGKAILIYSDGGNEISKVTVKKCTFKATQGAKAGAIANQNCAAIEIHNYGNGVDLVTEGNTYGEYFSGEWRIKTYENGRTKVFVNGTEYTTIAIDGKTMTIDANKNVTVNE